MPVQWKSTKFKGVRYYEHPTRQHGKQRDKYFAIRYQRDHKRVEEGIGWTSELDPKDQKHWTAEKVAVKLAELKEAARGLEKGPTRLKEKRDIEDRRKEAEQEEHNRLEKESITFGQYFENVYFPTSKTGKKKDTTRKGKEHFKNWIAPVIGNTPLKDVKPFAIEKIKKNILDAGKTPRSLQYVFATIRQAWNMAKRDGLVSSDSPTKQVKVPKVDNRRVRFLSHAEAATLLEALQAKDHLTHNLALLSLHCGLRMGEMAGLKWSHIDLDRGLITVMDAKCDRCRAAYMTEKIKAMFQAMTRRSPDRYVFIDRKDERLKDTPKVFFEVVKDLGFNNGISDPRQKACFHSLRHTFASWHVEAGTDLYTVKELLGHSVIAMTERYSHLGKNTLQSVTRNLEKAIEAAKKTGGKVVEIHQGE